MSGILVHGAELRPLRKIMFKSLQIDNVILKVLIPFAGAFKSRHDSMKKQQIQRFSASTRGFSLTELLVVLAIVGVLAWLVIPVIGRMRTFSQQTVCTSNLRTLHLASMDYASDYNGRFPVAKNPYTNYAIELACNGYLGLSGAGYWERLDTWVGLGQRREPFCLWCPSTERAQPRPTFNLATYCMNVNVGGTGDNWPIQPPVSTSTTLTVTTPAQTALFMDGCFRDGGYLVWVGEPGCMPAPVHPPNLYKQTNNPSRSVNVVFVDGHVELRPIGKIPSDFTNPFWIPNR